VKPSELTDEQLIDLIEGPPYELVDPFFLEHEYLGPGKFEGTFNPGLTERIYTATLDTSWIDEQTGTSDGPCGWAGRVGRFVLFENSDGFVDLVEFTSTEAAEKAMSTIDFDDIEELP